MSYHLLKEYDMALKLIEEFRKTQQVRESRESSDGEVKKSYV